MKTNYIFNGEIIHTDDILNDTVCINHVLIEIKNKLYITTTVVKSFDTNTINVHLEEYGKSKKSDLQYIEE
jgi:hypothetical protein